MEIAGTIILTFVGCLLSAVIIYVLVVTGFMYLMRRSQEKKRKSFSYWD